MEDCHLPQNTEFVYKLHFCKNTCDYVQEYIKAATTFRTVLNSHFPQLSGTRNPHTCYSNKNRGWHISLPSQQVKPYWLLWKPGCQSKHFTLFKRNRKLKVGFYQVQLLQNTLSLKGKMQWKGKLKRSHKQNKHVSLWRSTEEIILFSLRGW